MDPELVIVGEQIYPGDGPAFSGALAIGGGKILSASSDIPEGWDGPLFQAGQNLVMPGLIDLHVHGAMGHSASSGNLDELIGLARSLAKGGTTSFRPTSGAQTLDETERVILAVREFTLEGGAVPDGARSLGLHMEGPFLAPTRSGAMPPENIIAPNKDLMKRWLSLSSGAIAHMTLAPEVPGALSLARFLVEEGVSVGMGHTEATYEEAVGALEHGFGMATHVFCAMSGIHHRSPGAAGAALSHPGFLCELIADGIHLHPAILSLVYRAKGKDGVVLVSDSLPPAGLLPGQYSFLGKPVQSHESGRITLGDGRLAGSSLFLRHGVFNMVNKVGISMEDAVAMATVNPARAAGVFSKVGSLEPGKDADVVVFSPRFQVILVVIAGKVVHDESGFLGRRA